MIHIKAFEGTDLKEVTDNVEKFIGQFTKLEFVEHSLSVSSHGERNEKKTYTISVVFEDK